MSKNVKIPSEIYSRVSGYYRPVNQWNKGKQEEYACRKTINISEITEVVLKHNVSGVIS